MNVYVVPLVKPLTIIGEELPVPTIPPGLEVTVYPVMTEPFADGAVNVTVAWALVAEVATTFIGASG